MTLVRAGAHALLAAFACTALACSCGTPRVAPLPQDDDAGLAEEAATPEPTPTPWVEIAAAEVAPFPAGDPRAAQAAAVRDALQAFEEGRWEDTLTSLDAGGGASGPAPELSAWTRGRALEKLDRGWEALAVWHAIGPDSRFAAEALLAQARVHLEAGRANDALEALGGALPSTGAHPLAAGLAAARADVLRAQALRAIGDTASLAAAYEAYKRVWTTSPTSGAGAEAEAGLKSLASSVPKELAPGLVDRVARAGALGSRHQNDRVIKLLKADAGDLLAGAGGDAATACAGAFHLGRAYHKKRKYRDSVPLLDWAAEHCPDDESVIKALYLAAQGKSRSGAVSGSIAAFTSLADRFPEHSYADDGLHHAGRLAAAEGDHARAEALFDRQIREFPQGDMAGDTLWGRAHNHLRAGDAAAAIPHLETLAASDPRGPLRAAALQARYWLPVAQLSLDPTRRDAAAEALATLAEEHPLDYYGILAMWKLRSLDLSVAGAVHGRVAARVAALRGRPGEPETFRPDRAFMDQPGAQRAVALLRAGLGEEAVVQMGLALGDKPHDRWDRDTLLFASHVLAEGGDPYRSHNVLRFAFREEFPELAEDTLPLFGHAYPPAYIDEVRVASSGHAFPPLLFQGLVREESAFSATVVSWAGAIGLSQLMWPTAKMTARKMGIKGLRKSHLRVPERNLEIGAAYFQELHERWRGHLPLAIASYNAGPGATKKWVDARGDQSLDEWVEAIPYDQTRHYVKRVLGSFQVYSVLYGDGGPFVPLRVGPVRAALADADPAFDSPG